MGTLVDHARRELDRSGEDRAMVATLVAAVAVVAAYQPSGSQHQHMVGLLGMLLRGEPLTPLTANPDEWVDRSPVAGSPLWQNIRDSRAFSEDGGRTYRLCNDPADAQVRTSAHPRGWLLALQERDGIPERDAVAAVAEYLESGPLDDDDRDVLGRAGPAEQHRYLRQRFGVRGMLMARLLCRGQDRP